MSLFTQSFSYLNRINRIQYLTGIKDKDTSSPKIIVTCICNEMYFITEAQVNIKLQCQSLAIQEITKL